MDKTKDYGKFKFIPGNRPIDPRHVDHLVREIQKRNLLHLNPGLITPDFGIIDGQHRLKAAEICDVEYYYNTSDEVTKDDISRLNRNQKNWSTRDYINYFYYQKNKDFVAFKKFWDKNGQFTVGTLLKLVSSEATQRKDSVMEGILDMRSMDRANEVIAFINEIRNLPYEFDFIYDSRFPLVVKECLGTANFDKDIFIEKIKTNPRRFMRCHTGEEYRDLIEGIYNFGLSKNKIRLT